MQSAIEITQGQQVEVAFNHETLPCRPGHVKAIHQSLLVIRFDGEEFDRCLPESLVKPACQVS